MTYSVRAARADGTVLMERVDAENEEAVRRRLEGEGYLILSISRVARLSGVSFPSVGSFSPRHFIAFNRELLALVRAGIPIIRTLDILIERAEEGPFRKALESVRLEISQGSAIAEAMEKHPRFFPPLYTSSLRAGERTGTLAEVLQKQIEYHQKVMQVRQKVVSALAYPLFLLVVGVGVVLFLLLYVLPSFSHIYSQSSIPLPWGTRLLMGIVMALRGHLLLSFFLAVAALLLARSLWRLPEGRKILERGILRIPFFGAILEKDQVVRAVSTLSTVLKSGVPLVAALQMVAQAMTRVEMAKKMEGAAERVREGSSLAAAFGQTGFFSRMAVEMVGIGEATGTLDEMLSEIARFHEEELDVTLARVTRWIEPVLLLLMGGLVAFILIAMYLPIFQLAGTIR